MAASGGIGLLGGSQVFSLVTAVRESTASVATGDGAAIGVDIVPHIVADTRGARRVTLTNQTSHELTFEIDVGESPAGSVSPGSLSLSPDESGTFYSTVETSSSDSVLPFTVIADSRSGYRVDLSRRTEVYGVSRVIRDRAENSNARYDFTYRIDGFPRFDHLEVQFENLDKS